MKNVADKLKYYWKENKIFILKYLYAGIKEFLLGKLKVHKRKKQKKFRKFEELAKDRKEITIDMNYGNGIKSKIILSAEDVGLSMDLAVDGIREPLLVNWMLELLKPNMTIVDIGANLGYYLLMEAKISKKVYGIEPNPKSFGYLKRSVALNNLNNVELLNMGIGNKKGVIPFYMSSSWNLSRFEKQTILNDKVEEVSIPIDTLDDLFKDKKVDLVRMDVEGYEKYILRGMETLIKNNPGLLIVVEFHSNLFDMQERREFISWLSQNGLIIKRLAKGKLTKTINNFNPKRIMNLHNNCFMVLEAQPR